MQLTHIKYMYWLYQRVQNKRKRGIKKRKLNHILLLLLLNKEKEKSIGEKKHDWKKMKTRD